jgi:hypothetical protein
MRCSPAVNGGSKLWIFVPYSPPVSRKVCNSSQQAKAVTQLILSAVEETSRSQP